jgi:Zn-dependent protease with chaperone function
VIQLAALLRVVEPALLLVAATILMAVPALAQQPGGDIFGGNDQVLGNGVREAIRWGRNLLFLLGVGGIAWGTINYMTEKAYLKQMIGGGLAMSLGGIASLIYSFSQGNAVNLDTDLGN